MNIHAVPAVQEPEIIQQLKGHSGCTVLLCRYGESYFIRKISSSIAYNDRFQKQIEKQVLFHDAVPVPRILGTGMIGGMRYCDMEYITATDFRSFIVARQVTAIPKLVDHILTIIERFADPADGFVPAQNFIGKIESTACVLRSSPRYPAHSDTIERAIKTLAEHPWSGIPKTLCHGDFTLENMLIGEDGSIVLIDLLDGALESVWLDIAKLSHDLSVGWSCREQLWKSDLSADDRLMRLLCSYLRDELLSVVTLRFPAIANHLASLQTLQALRVLPYTNDEPVFARLVASIHHYHHGSAPR